MVPQRAIPFRVVAVLGLNDGEFPRTASDGGLDLMARHRRLGDRDTRSDDR
jgi:exodeoxyribonuclease V gamma subunit